VTDINNVLFLGYPNVGEQDLLAPWELFRSLAWSLREHGEQLEITLGAFTSGPITTHMGATLGIERQIGPDDRFDLVYVPGGVGAGAASRDQTLLQFIRDHHSERRWVAGNCAGIGVLHRAGILDGVAVTAPATLSRRLSAEGATIAAPRRAWLIAPQHRIASAGGAATVHPSTIALVWHLFGDHAAHDLAASWDSLALSGNQLFSLVGPEMHDDRDIVAAVQTQWEDVLLPPAANRRPATPDPISSAKESMRPLLISNSRVAAARAGTVTSSTLPSPSPNRTVASSTPETGPNDAGAPLTSSPRTR
jgi:transcriptional regulator GlxA family with amidase domain